MPANKEVAVIRKGCTDQGRDVLLPLATISYDPHNLAVKDLFAIRLLWSPPRCRYPTRSMAFKNWKNVKKNIKAQKNLFTYCKIREEKNWQKKKRHRLLFENYQFSKTCILISKTNQNHHNQHNNIPRKQTKWWWWHTKMLGRVRNAQKQNSTPMTMQWTACRGSIDTGLEILQAICAQKRADLTRERKT